jgi:hypothetical protein
VSNWRKKQASDNKEIILEKGVFLKGEKEGYIPLFLVISAGCGG